MLRFARRAAGHAFRRMLLRSGREIVRTRPGWPSDEYVFKQIAELRPDVVLDVGANEGQFVNRLRASGYSGKVISFEPQHQPFAALLAQASLDPAWECHQLAVGNAAANLPMHMSAFSPSSSLLPIGRLHIDLMPNTQEIGIETVTVVRLDELLSAADFSSRGAFLKLDVQGYELPALRGAGDLVRNFAGALVELNFSSLFVGQSKYYDVMAALDLAGLRFVRLSDVNYHPQTGHLLWADALFLR